MEKFVYTLIMVIGFSTTTVYADDKMGADIDRVVTQTYSPIAFDRLPRTVQEVLALGFPCFVVNSVQQAQVKGSVIIYKVVLSDPENLETTLYITNKGEILG